MGFLDLFRRRRRPRPAVKLGLTPERVGEVVRAYGLVLEASAPDPGCYADESKLPYPKDVIRASILGAMSMTTDPNMRGHLEAGYMALASWQPNVGPHDVGLSVAAVARVAAEPDALKAATLLDNAQDGDAASRYSTIATAAEAERARLLQELDALRARA